MDIFKHLRMDISCTITKFVVENCILENNVTILQKTYNYRFNKSDLTEVGFLNFALLYEFFNLSKRGRGIIEMRFFLNT